MAKQDQRPGILGGIVWLFIASSVVTLLLRLGYDALGKQPQGSITALLYDWSNTLLLPISWLDSYLELPKTFANVSLTIPLAIGLYVLVGWLVMAVMARNRG